MFEILFTNRALKDLRNFDNNIRKRIIKKIGELNNEPVKKSRKLINKKIGQYRFRIGVYRVIFDIEDNNIIILRIGNRKEIYK